MKSTEQLGVSKYQLVFSTDGKKWKLLSSSTFVYLCASVLFCFDAKSGTSEENDRLAY